MAVPLHPHNSCFSLAMVYIHTILVLHWSRLKPMHCSFPGSHFFDFIYGWMYLSTTSTGFIKAKAIYYIYTNYGVFELMNGKGWKVDVLSVFLSF